MANKLKTHAGAKKRFKKTASGKIKVKKSGRRHLLECKSAKRRRRMRESSYLSKGFEKSVSKLMPYG